MQNRINFRRQPAENNMPGFMGCQSLLFDHEQRIRGFQRAGEAGIGFN